MNDRTRVGLGVLAVAVVLGVLGDALLRATPWGLNVFLWMAVLVASVVVLVHRQRLALLGEGRWLVPPVLLLAAAFAWRDSPALRWLDALALVVVLSLIARRARSRQIRLASLVEYALGLSRAGFNVGLGFPLLVNEIQWKEIPRQGWSGHALAVGRGLLIACPLLLVFGSLLTAADAVFEDLVRNTLRLNFSELATHLVSSAIGVWIVSGYLRGMLMGKEPGTPSARRPGLLGVVEMGTALGLLNVLFLGFVVVQFRYFFGGAGLVEVTSGLTYAAYARRGFFELVAVAALVLPLLLLADGHLRQENPGHVRLFRALAGAQILLLFVIMASAVHRMRLYQSEYGLTQLRLYTTAFMGWLALVFIWFAATVLRGQRERFAFGALVAGFLMIVGLHILNPDALIVRTNVARADAGRCLDTNYVTSLSADAVPTLVAALPTLNQEDSGAVAARLRQRWSAPERRDWRTWNWARARAWRVVREYETALQEIANRQP